MEMIKPDSETLLLPETLPRKVKWRNGWRAAGRVWGARFFMFPHTLIGFGSIAFLFCVLLFLVFNWAIPGKTVSAQIRFDGGRQHQFIRYSYKAGGREYEKEEEISQDLFEQLT